MYFGVILGTGFLAALQRYSFAVGFAMSSWLLDCFYCMLPGSGKPQAAAFS